MSRVPRPPVAAVIGFIDCVNRGDIDGLTALMTDDHQLLIPGAPPVVGRDANRSAWRDYVALCPTYVIYPHQITEPEGLVAVLGHTTGSHLGLPDDEEARETLIWVAEVRDGLLKSWRLLDDTPDNRRTYGFAMREGSGAS
jgi:hypothetical protein